MGHAELTTISSFDEAHLLGSDFGFYQALSRGAKSASEQPIPKKKLLMKLPVTGRTYGTKMELQGLVVDIGSRG